jgi:DNA-binding NarL/FixJ family response regulator
MPNEEANHQNNDHLRRKYVGKERRLDICRAFEEGKINKQIANLYRVALGTVKSVIRTFKERGCVETLRLGG